MKKRKCLTNDAGKLGRIWREEGFNPHINTIKQKLISNGLQMAMQELKL